MKYHPTAKDKNTYDTRGLVIFENFLDADVCAKWDAALREAKPTHFENEQEVTSGGFFGAGKNLYNYLDTFAILEACPEIVDFYVGNIEWLRKLTDAEVVRSNYFKSAITAVQFEAPGSTQTWHRESNPVTAILYLTDNPTQGAIEVIGNDTSDSTFLYPKRGRLIVMNGRYIPHRVHAMETSERRVSLVCNYYLRGDHARPADADSLIYGDHD
jgi:hypothetical protein